ncbi:MAG TPA: glycosyltransferase family 1 protein [Verrucomicrobiae bacterium]|nr:glycosyltransferase family 1 protein [Verrucomicrobiae bacterium]
MMSQMAPSNRSDGSLRVALDARIPAGRWGGIQQVVEGLAYGLSRLDGGDEYVFLAERGASAWLAPMIGGGSHIVEVPRGYGRTRVRRAYEAVAERAPAAARIARRAASRLTGVSMPIAKSDGFVESIGVDIVHFTTPQAYLTHLPSIYQPHDLLHRHHPEQFDAIHARYREDAYRAFSEAASIVAVMTEWGRADICRVFGLPAGRIAVVPWAPVAGLRRISEPSRDLDLPDRFLLYPAQTWPHKNHIRLIEALAMLRDRGTVVPLVCTGRQTEHMAAIRRRIDALGIGDQVRFLGYVSADDLDAIYRRATALVFPSRFEGWGLPVVEAFAFDLPVASSNATCLPEVAGGGALMFDPESTEDMASAISRIWTDERLRSELRSAGRRRVGELSWERTARIYRALYRQVAGRVLTDEDRALLAPPTLP